jgi:FkbM family methyltransferase
MVCLDFLAFCIDHRKNLRFDLGLFKNEEDKTLVQEYVRNNLHVALSSHNPKKTKKDNYWAYKYEMFRGTVEKKAENFVLKKNNCEYILPVNHFDEAVFYHEYGLSELPAYIKENLANKDFIDAGAFIGDSALIFNKLKPSKIYAFEPSRKNYFLMQKTLSLNGLSNVVPIHSALGNTESSSNLFTWGNASFISEKGTEEIKTTTIDSLQEKCLSNIGLIKMDIEGSEFNAIQGAEKTIKKFKPVLIISLYHRGRDFFEIPRILKEWVPTYNFRFLNLNRAAPILEKVLLAYLNAVL